MYLYLKDTNMYLQIWKGDGFVPFFSESAQKHLVYVTAVKHKFLTAFAGRESTLLDKNIYTLMSAGCIINSFEQFYQMRQ